MGATAGRTGAPAIAGSARHTQVQKGAFVVGVVFLLIGVLGFVPGVTEPYGELTWATADSTAELFHVFTVSVLHNVVHLVFGVLGVLLSRTALRARNYLLYGGGFYFLLWVYGLVVVQSSVNWIPVDHADNALHQWLAVAMGSMGLWMDRGRDEAIEVARGETHL